MRRLACLSLLVFGLLAPTAAAEGEQYALVNNCYALQGAGGAVGKDGEGYRTGAARAEAFRMQATDLGKYLLYGRDREMPAVGESDSVVVTRDAGPPADWSVEPSGGAFRLVRPDTGKVLVAGDGGRLALADAGSAGDRGRFTFERADGCSTFPEITTNATGTPSRGETSFGETKGLVDAHMHLMAYEFIGGSVHCGRPWHPYGVEKALVDCPDHQTGAAALETGLGGKERHDPVGWPTFKDWPDNQSLTHETSYYKWLERAWMGGLRVYVNLFVDNEVLCEVYPLKRNTCNEMQTVRLQAQRISELQDYIDAQNGGPGKGWFRIVKSPFEARRVINDGKLAVVLGIEISKLFDCGVVNDVPTCDRAQIDRQLDEVYRLGVRDMELVNKFDNGLAGVAGDAGQTGLVTNTGNKYDTNQFLNMETCTGPPEAADKPQPTVAGEPGDGRDQLVGAFQTFLPPGQAPIYSAAPHCNREGLSDLGEYLVGRMIEKGMIIDPDHLSVAARNEVLALVEKARYSGIISSHTWSSPDALPRIYDVGGFVTPYAGNSTKFVEEWKKTKPMANPRFWFGFGYGADMNGFGSQGDPRGAGVPNPVSYPFKSFDGAVTFDKQKSGERVYDINVDGVDHYGLYPDWIEDLRKLAGDEIVADMGRGAEGYLQMWERAEGVPATRCQPARARATARGFRSTGNGTVRVGLGDTADEVLRRASQPNARPGQAWRYCLQGPRDGRPPGDLRPVLSREGRVVLVGATGPEHEALRVGRGDRVTRRLRRGARRVGTTLLVRKAGRDARYVYGVRRGRVTFVAVADRSIAGTKTLRRHLRLAGL
jgi:hypothetical protein